MQTRSCGRQLAAMPDWDESVRHSSFGHRRDTHVLRSVGKCSGRGNDRLYRYVGSAAGGTWTRIDNTDGLVGGFGVFAVDPNNPNRLYASNLGPTGPRMVFSTDSGTELERRPRARLTDDRGRGLHVLRHSAGRHDGKFTGRSTGTRSRACSRTTPRTATSSWPGERTRESSSAPTGAGAGRCSPTR